MFKCILLIEEFSILIPISLKYVFEHPIDNKATLIQIMAWRWTDDKALSEPMLAFILLMYLCVVSLNELTVAMLNLFQKRKICPFIYYCIIPQCWHGTSIWNISLWKPGTYLSCLFDKFPVDGSLYLQGFSSHGIDLIIREYSGFSTRIIKQYLL